MNLKSIILMTLFVLISGICDTNSVYAQGVAYPCGPDGAPLLRFLTPQGFMGADFRGSCAQHDACYQIPGISRRYCDLQLRQELYHRCNYSRFPLGCRMVANTMYLQVRLFGRRPFLNSQYQSPYPAYYGY